MLPNSERTVRDTACFDLSDPSTKNYISMDVAVKPAFFHREKILQCDQGENYEYLFPCSTIITPTHSETTFVSSIVRRGGEGRRLFVNSSPAWSTYLVPV